MNKGFTLIEILVTLSLIFILTSISIPLIRFFNSQLVKAEILSLEMDIEYLKEFCKLKNRESLINLNPNSNSYLIDKKEEHKLHKNVEFNFIKGIKGPPSNPTKSIEKAITFHNNEIFFDKNGKIDSGIAYFRDKDSKYMYALTVGVSKKQIVRKYKYAENKWTLIS